MWSTREECSSRRTHDSSGPIPYVICSKCPYCVRDLSCWRATNVGLPCLRRAHGGESQFSRSPTRQPRQTLLLFKPARRESVEPLSPGETHEPAVVEVPEPSIGDGALNPSNRYFPWLAQDLATPRERGSGPATNPQVQGIARLRSNSGEETSNCEPAGAKRASDSSRSVLRSQTVSTQLQIAGAGCPVRARGGI